MAEDEQGVELESPMEIHVKVEDVNDNAPECTEAESVFEVQENQNIGKIHTHMHVETTRNINSIGPFQEKLLYRSYFLNFLLISVCVVGYLGSHVGDLMVHDADKSLLLIYKILSQSPTNPSDGMFTIDETRGKIQVAKHNFRRKDVPQYHLKVSVTDGGEVILLLQWWPIDY